MVPSEADIAGAGIVMDPVAGDDPFAQEPPFIGCHGDGILIAFQFNSVQICVVFRGKFIFSESASNAS